MDDDHRELVQRLFVAATAMLEDAIEVAVAGQSPRLDPSELADHGRRLHAAGDSSFDYRRTNPIYTTLSPADHPKSRPYPQFPHLNAQNFARE